MIQHVFCFVLLFCCWFCFRFLDYVGACPLHSVCHTPLLPFIIFPHLFLSQHLLHINLLLPHFSLSAFSASMTLQFLVSCSLLTQLHFLFSAFLTWFLSWVLNFLDSVLHFQSAQVYKWTVPPIQRTDTHQNLIWFLVLHHRLGALFHLPLSSTFAFLSHLCLFTSSTSTPIIKQCQYWS